MVINFPSDWIAPGEFKFCSKCGQFLIPLNKTWCDACTNKPCIGDFICGVCGERASVFFVHGYRCDSHVDVKNPSSATITEYAAVSYGKLREGYVFKEESREAHHRLTNERNALAKKRRDADVPRFFWLDHKMEKS